jgi:mannan endo-1,4-beta-mannosidase
MRPQSYRRQFGSAVRVNGRLFLACALVVTLIGMPTARSSASSASAASTLRPVDPAATPQTVALYQNLAAVQGSATLFGHQDDLAYGHSWSAQDGRSDVKEVVGAYPSVLGFDLGRLELGAAQNIDGVNFDNMKRWIRQGYQLGSVITLSWHSVNPVTGGGYGDNTSPNTIAAVLPGGPQHDVLVGWLDRFAAFAEDLVDEQGRPIPLVFRPYHEHSGDWFWWGVDNGLNSAENYQALWRFTFDYLTGVKGMHNLLWAVSPDRSRLNLDTLADEYLAIYPGDEYVDIIGIDNYFDMQSLPNYVRTLESVSQLALAHNKLAAQTETGSPTSSTPWTGYLLAAHKSSEATRRILWSLVWRNPVGQEGGAPYPGSATATDFVDFYRDDFTMFQDTLPDLYTTTESSGSRSGTSS